MNAHKAGVRVALFGLLLFWLWGCASVREGEREDTHLQETKSFEDFTFSQIWDAALQSVAEIDFVVQKKMVESGFIYAQGKADPNSLYLPPHMNIYIRQEYGKISARCHVTIPGNRDDYKHSSSYVNLFFSAMYKNLRQLKNSRDYFKHGIHR